MEDLFGKGGKHGFQGFPFHAWLSFNLLVSTEIGNFDAEDVVVVVLNSDFFDFVREWMLLEGKHVVEMVMSWTIDSNENFFGMIH